MNCSLILSSPSSPRPLSDCCKSDCKSCSERSIKFVEVERTVGFFTLLPPTGLISWTSSSRNLAQKKPQQKLSFPKEARLSQATSDLNSFRFKCKNRAKEQDRDTQYFCSWEYQKVHSIGTSEVWRLGLWGRKEYSSERLSKFKKKISTWLDKATAPAALRTAQLLTSFWET